MELENKINWNVTLLILNIYTMLYVFENWKEDYNSKENEKKPNSKLSIIVFMISIFQFFLICHLQNKSNKQKKIDWVSEYIILRLWQIFCHCIIEFLMIKWSICSFNHWGYKALECIAVSQHDHGWMRSNWVSYTGTQHTSSSVIGLGSWSWQHHSCMQTKQSTRWASPGETAPIRPAGNITKNITSSCTTPLKH
jgi:hypothetical protein